MAALIDEKAALQNMEDKMLQELKASNIYEALQYVQSFIARKKKSIGTALVSSMVFHAAKLLIDYNSAGYAGTLLLWFMEGGAGEENSFYIENKREDDSLEGTYCDLSRLTGILTDHSQENASVILDVIQKQVLTLTEGLPTTYTTPMGRRLANFEEACASLFEFKHNFRLAYKFRLRLGDMKALAKSLDLWASNAYPTERPLFFVRSILHLLVANEQQKALELLEAAKLYVVENEYPTMVAWHFAIMVCELIDLPATADVNKATIYEIMQSNYSKHLNHLDPKFGPLLVPIGVKCFGCKAPANSGGLNPFAMLEALSGGKKNEDGGMDISNIMNMMQSMNTKRK